MKAPHKCTTGNTSNIITGLEFARPRFFSQRLAFPAFHWRQGMFQSPRPSVPDRVGPVVLMTSTMSPRRVLS